MAYWYRLLTVDAIASNDPATGSTDRIRMSSGSFALADRRMPSAGICTMSVSKWHHLPLGVNPRVRPPRPDHRSRRA